VGLLLWRKGVGFGRTLAFFTAADCASCGEVPGGSSSANRLLVPSDDHQILHDMKPVSSSAVAVESRQRLLAFAAAYNAAFVCHCARPLAAVSAFAL
jgi:hypothetical protein